MRETLEKLAIRYIRYIMTNAAQAHKNVYERKVST